MGYVLYVLAAAAFCATLSGGLFALRFKDKLHLVLGFSAGAVIGVAFFDLLPEAIALGGGHFGTATITSVVAFAFLVYLFLDRFVLLHAHADEEGHGDPFDTLRASRGTLSAGTLSVHSFLDGLAIGFAFQVSAIVGVIVAAAVLTHDFSDGINTINLILKNGGNKKTALRWLLIDAIAPVVGIATTAFFTVSESTLGLILATFCGFFLYIGASDLLPESHHRHPTIWTTISTALGIGVLYLAVSLAHF
jgi:ZIP family zinc transporter